MADCFSEPRAYRSNPCFPKSLQTGRNEGHDRLESAVVLACREASASVLSGEQMPCLLPGCEDGVHELRTRVAKYRSGISPRGDRKSVV